MKWDKIGPGWWATDSRGRMFTARKVGKRWELRGPYGATATRQTLESAQQVAEAWRREESREPAIWSGLSESVPA